MADGGRILVTVLYSPAPRDVHEWELALPPGATVCQALQASGLSAVLPDADLANSAVGIWGRKAKLDDVLRPHDRVEVYRPLEIDPKVARRERFRKQGVRAAGLFVRKKLEAGPDR